METRKFTLSSRINDAFDLPLGMLSDLESVALEDSTGVVGPVLILDAEYSLLDYPGDPSEKLLLLRLPESNRGETVLVKGTWAD